jgi:hypothetical protein
MKFREIHYARGATINVGNFNNVRVECSASVTLDPADDEAAAFTKLRDWIEKRVAAEARRYTKGD